MRPGSLFAATLTFALLVGPLPAAAFAQDLPAPEGWAALERGEAEKAERLYEKGQFWLDRLNKLLGNS